MDNAELMAYAIAAVAVCMVIITKAVLSYMGKQKAVDKINKYFPYAVMAAKYVEKNVPDDYGTNDEDSTTAKAAHKLDLFLKKFVENVEKFTGAKANDELKAAAAKWSVELAEKVGK